MKKFALFLLAFTALFSRERVLLPPLSFEEENQGAFKQEAIKESRNKRLYISGGITLPLPTISIGCRLTYGLFASDFSFSGVIPAIHYKQLFSLTRWDKRYVPYFGPKIGVYVVSSKDRFLDLGAVTGLQINGEKLGHFLELGVGANILGTCGRTGWGMPALCYGILF